MTEKEIVYILENAGMPGLIKIGFTTTSVEQRMDGLYSTGVPYPFECVHASVVTDGKKVENVLHDAFDEHRVPSGREFFRVKGEKVKAILRLLELEDVTPRTTPNMTEELKAFIERRPPFRFSLAQIPVGAELQFIRDENIVCKVVDDKAIEFQGQITSLSAAASEMLRRYGRSATQVQGPIYWTYEGETLEERRLRIEATT